MLTLRPYHQAAIDAIKGCFAEQHRGRSARLAAVVDTSISGRRVAPELTALIARRGCGDPLPAIEPQP